MNTHSLYKGYFHSIYPFISGGKAEYDLNAIQLQALLPYLELKKICILLQALPHLEKDFFISAPPIYFFDTCPVLQFRPKPVVVETIITTNDTTITKASNSKYRFRVEVPFCLHKDALQAYATSSHAWCTEKSIWHAHTYWPEKLIDSANLESAQQS